MSADEEYSESGSPIYRHEERKTDFVPADMHGSSLDEISDHIERYIGPIDHVFHEILSDLVHIDVHVVLPSDARPWTTLVTSGMSDKPMTVPEGAEKFRYAELLIELPPYWPLSQEDFENEDHYWPVRWLKQMARLPHEYDTWLGYGHTVPNGDPPEPFASNTSLCCMAVLLPYSLPVEFSRLSIREDKEIGFWSVVPIYKGEVDYKMKHGIEELEELFEKHHIGNIIEVQRRDVTRKKFFGLF